MFVDLSGPWTCEIPGIRASVNLPGTLDGNGVGFPDDPARQWKADEVRRIGFYTDGDPIVTRLTRKHTFEGQASFSRVLEWNVPEGLRVFADVERARQLRLEVNGREAPAAGPESLSAPRCFEVTGLVTGQDRLVFRSDNSYPGWPRGAIVYSSAASDETQTNWNGLLGFLRLRTEKQVFISGVRVYPRGRLLDVVLEIDAAVPWHGRLLIESEALERPASLPANLPSGRHELSARALPVRPDARLWDLEEGNLHTLTVSAPGLDPRTVSFGLRDFRAADGRLTLNGRGIFLRGETSCAAFPETGYIPMEPAAWKTILLKYRSYGVNFVRFHSHCPPEAAFIAADALGMLLQPELSHWDPENAFGSADAKRYYETELFSILRSLANHPSFVMLTLGNELSAGADGLAFMGDLLRRARLLDGTRLYANGSNTFYGAAGPDPDSDFYTAMELSGRDMRATCDGPKGWLNGEYPGTRRDYSAAVAALREKSSQPVFSFEVGQYEILPDFGETARYQGVTLPANLEHVRRKVREKGFAPHWRRMVEATGESALLCYRAEVESALRTEGYSGISLLGLQDFPGQGTALIGMMDAHLEPKPYDFARPERFAAFFRDELPLVLMEKYVYTAGETLTAGVKIANYGKRALSGRAEWSLSGGDFVREGALPVTAAPPGGLSAAGSFRVSFPEIEKPLKLTLKVVFCGFENTYPVWVYPDLRPVCPENIAECRSFDETAEQVLRAGGTVYLSPDSTAEALPRSVQAHFSPDFWSVCTFPEQSGCMGQWIRAEHPLFRNFPTDFFSSWQWWVMAGRRAVVLPEPIDCIVAEMDSFALLRPMAKLFECRCGAGKLLFSSLGLHRLSRYPEARALQQAVYDYLSSGSFRPDQELSPDFLRSLF